MEDSKRNAIKNLNALSEKLYNILIEYYFNEYRFYLEEYWLVEQEEKDYSETIIDLIFQAKQSEKLTKDEYKKNLFFCDFTGEKNDYIVLLNEYLLKLSYNGIFSKEYNLNDSFIEIFQGFYEHVADWFSELLSSKENITREDVLEEIDAMDFDLDICDPFMESITEEQEKFDEEVTQFLWQYVHLDFLKNNPKNSFNDYYEKYCLAGDKTKHSTKDNIYYDFDCKDKYRNYGDKVHDFNNSGKVRSSCLGTFIDISETVETFDKLFKGDYYISLCLFNGKKNMPISFTLHSFSKPIKNYGNKKTIDVIRFEGLRNISIYPIDAKDFETKFREIVKKYIKEG